MNKRRTWIFCFFIFFVVISVFLYFDAFATYTSYESNVNDMVKSKTAKFVVKINDENIITSDGTTKNMNITSNVDTSSYVTTDKIAPGLSLTVPIKLNVYGSEVAIKYTFDIKDKLIDEDKLLTLTGNNFSDYSLIRTGKNEYTGVIKLDDLNSSKDYNFKLKFTFIDDDIKLTDSITTTDVSDLFDINFTAVQYNGETITEYTES